MSKLSGWQRWFSESEVRMATAKVYKGLSQGSEISSRISHLNFWPIEAPSLRSPRVHTMKSYRREDANLERIRSQFVLDRIKTEAILWKRSDAEETQRENGGVGLWKVSFVINYMTFLAVVVSARNRMSNDVWQRPHRARPATALAHTLHYPPRK